MKEEHQETVYTIPWNKKIADSILTGEKYFGEDSINITNIAEVQYIVKFPLRQSSENIVRYARLL